MVIDDELYRRLVESTGDHALFVLDTDGCISVWPATARRIYRYEDTDVVGSAFDVLFADSGAQAAPVEELLDEATDGPVEVDSWHERADGSVFWASCTVSPLSDGAFDGYVVVAQDTTTRKQYERKLERQNDRLKESTDILSHDLRTPLSVIDGRLELFYETGDEKHLEAIETTTGRMERLVDDLLRVARQGHFVDDPESTRLGSVVDVAREGTIPDGVAFSYEPVGVLMADPDRLVQLFENLFRNCVEHSSTDSRAQPGDSVEHSSTGNRTASPSGDSLKHGGVSVRVGPLADGFYVEDDGPGIPPDERERVFDHGYTTRAGGTGYGLSVVQSVVGAHGWDVAVIEGADGGARFEITNVEFVDEP